MSQDRYMTRKPCPTCGVRTSALATRLPGGSLDVTGPVFHNARTGALSVACRGCGRVRNADMVRGRFSAKHECNARCLASTGFHCECSCGGKNHGASHAGA